MFHTIEFIAQATENTHSESYCLKTGHVYFPPYNEEASLDDIIHVLKMQGASGFSTAEGQFAIAFSHKGRITLIRDSFGVIPLYYIKQSATKITFATDINRLSAVSASCALNTKVLECIRGIGYNLYPGETIYAHIKSVPPGHSTTISRSHTITEQYTATTEQQQIDLQLLHNYLDNGIIRTLDTFKNQKAALFFSGGLDSSYLLCKSVNHSNITPFTMWDGENMDDINDARIIAKELGIRLHEVQTNADELDKAIINYAWHFAMPISGCGFDVLGGVAFHILAQRIHQAGYRLALCGEGADEIFLGYHQYHMDPSLLITRLEQAINRYSLFCLKDRLSELGLFSSPDDTCRKIADTFGLSEYHLPSVHCSGTAAMLEIIPPFLSQKLINLTRQTPLEYLVDKKNYWTKKLLREFFQSIHQTTHSKTAIRRKRPMTYSVQSLQNHVMELMRKSKSTLSQSEIFWRLFFFLHVYNSFESAPDLSFSQVLPLLENIDCRI